VLVKLPKNDRIVNRNDVERC